MAIAVLAHEGGRPMWTSKPERKSAAITTSDYTDIVTLTGFTDLFENGRAFKCVIETSANINVKFNSATGDIFPVTNSAALTAGNNGGAYVDRIYVNTGGNPATVSVILNL